MIPDGHRRVAIIGAGHAGGSCALPPRGGGLTRDIILIGDELHLPREWPALSKAGAIVARGVGRRGLRNDPIRFGVSRLERRPR